MRQARNCWPALVKKASDEVTQTQTELAAAMARVDQLNASHQRLCRLYDEYRLKEQQGQTEVMGMQASMNQRQFMSQLLTLMQRVKTDILYTENTIIGIKERLMLAERERIKMQTLADQNAQAVQREENKKDQRRMDALGVMQFNLKPQA